MIGTERSMAGVTAAVPSMLVVTSAALGHDHSVAPLAAWARGHRVLLSTLDSETPDPPAEDGWITVECLNTTADPKDLLCRAMTRMPYLIEDLRGPLLFVTCAQVPIPYPERLDAWSLEAEYQPTGQLARLALGTSVVASGLLGPFFEIMSHRKTGARTFVDLLRGTQLAERA